MKCLKTVSEGMTFPARLLLEKVPIYEGLKAKAEENNHGQDGKTPTRQNAEELATKNVE